MAVAAVAGIQAKKRLEAARKAQENEIHISTLLDDFDTSKDGRLDKKELGDLLQVFNQGNRPSDEEIDWVYSVADKSDGKENASETIRLSELKVALNSWTTYCDNKATIDSVFQRYDKDHTGTLEFADLKRMLADLNDGVEPSDDEISNTMKKATGRTWSAPVEGSVADHEGVRRTEVLQAIAIWYAHVEEKEKQEAVSSGCCIIM